jgi:hypothetical protein
MEVPMASDRVPLRDGPTVPAVVIEWLLGLSDRGLTIAMGTDGLAHVSDPSALTAADHLLIGAHRLAIRAAVAYSERVDTWPLDRIGTLWTPQPDTPLTAAPPAIPPPAPPTTVSAAPQPEPVPVSLWSREP